jgi:hypothetical protein
MVLFLPDPRLRAAIGGMTGMIAIGSQVLGTDIKSLDAAVQGSSGSSS